MDGTHHSSPPSTSTPVHATSCLQSSTSPTLSTHPKRYSEPAAGRQRRLLQNRNARFPAKKLSLSNLGSKFTQLIHANDEPQAIDALTPNQENHSPVLNRESVYKKQHVPTNSLGILEELSNTTVNRRPRQSGDIPIFQDTPERRLLEQSPSSSPTTYRDSLSQECSPFGYSNSQDSQSEMRLREISGNEHRGSSLASSPFNGSLKAIRKRKSTHVRPGFDTQEYIEHLEKELQQARNETISPNTKKLLKDQLRNARVDNEKLQQDISEMRDMYEAEVKRTLEHQATLEVELKRQVRDLEEDLEDKICIIKDLELQHDERRLDTSTIDTLKATIEKLEHEKNSLADENRSVSKRNEVLSELLAMSPTKMQSFELRSPVRERRGAGRPMSMIIPRIPTSPTSGQLSQAASAIASPSLSACGSVLNPSRSCVGSPLMTAHGAGIGLGLAHTETLGDLSQGPNESEQGYFGQRRSSGIQSRRSTLQSQVSFNDVASALSSTSSPVDQAAQRILPKRKPRKFMFGSTQLKPLLLPALTGDVRYSISSVASSPLVDLQQDVSQDLNDPMTCFLPRPVDAHYNESAIVHRQDSAQTISNPSGESAAPVYRNLKNVVSRHEMVADMKHLNDVPADVDESPRSSSCEDTILEQQEGSKVFANLLTELPSDNIGQLTGFGEELVWSASPHIGTSLAPARSFPHYGSLDLDALESLNLPDPEYDAFPTAPVGADETLSTDVPEPLFSMHTQHPQPNQAYSPTHVIESSNPTQDWLEGVPSCAGCSSRCCSMCVNAASSPTPSLQASEHTSSDRPAFSPQSKFRNTESLMTSKGTLDILRSGKLGARPLAAMTMNSIFGTITQCTGQLRDFRKEPLALSRRVLANAWFSHWARLGRLSWWVLGLFMSSGFGGPRLKEWNWERYDGEEIARRVCQEGDDCQPCHSLTSQRPSSADEAKTGWGKSLMLWSKFSIAIMLAVGGAVVKGPGELLKETDHNESACAVCSHLGKDRLMCYCSSHQTVTDINLEQSHRRDPHRLHDRLPAPAVFPHMSKHKAQVPQYVQLQTVPSEEETLRANSQIRTHVADIFQRTNFSRLGDYGDRTGPVTMDRHCQPASDDGIIQWPPSPDRIHSQGSYSADTNLRRDQESSHLL